MVVTSLREATGGKQYRVATDRRHGHDAETLSANVNATYFRATDIAAGVTTSAFTVPFGKELAMPLVRRLGGRRITKTRRRGAVIEVRLAADPSAGLAAQWVRVTPEAYGAERTYFYQPLPVRGDSPCS